MVKTIVSLLFFLSIESAKAQFEHPLNWRFNDLEKLTMPCVVASRIELDKRQRPTSDSTLEWCMCYDRATRRLDAKYCWTTLNGKGGHDTLEWTDFHRWFDADGQVIFEGDHSLTSLLGEGTAETTRTRRIEYGQGEFRRRELTLSVAGRSQNNVTSWFMDSLVVINDTLSVQRKYYTAGLEREVHMDLTQLHRSKRDPGIIREVSSRNGRKFNSVTRRFDGAKLIYRVDSIFDRPALDGRIGALLEDATYEYADTVLIREIHRAVNDNEDTWQPTLCADICYTYANGDLKRIEYRNAKGHRIKSPNFEYDVDPEVPTPWFRDPFRVAGINGLPLILSSDYGDGPEHILRFENSDSKPVGLPDGTEFEHIRTFEPQ